MGLDSLKKIGYRYEKILPKTLKSTSAFLWVATFVFVGFLGGGEVEARKKSKMEICHYDEDKGIFELIFVNGNAIRAHLDNHGDIFPGGTDGTITLDGDCNEVVLHRTLARAYIDRDRSGSFNAAQDVVIAELIDTNDDNMASAGDTVVLNEYPLDFDPCPDPQGTCTETGKFNPVVPLIGTQATNSNSSLSVTIASQTQYVWTKGLTFELFSANDGLGDRALIFDDTAAVLPNILDVDVVEQSPTLI